MSYKGGYTILDLSQTTWTKDATADSHNGLISGIFTKLYSTNKPIMIYNFGAIGGNDIISPIYISSLIDNGTSITLHLPQNTYFTTITIYENDTIEIE